MSTQSLKLDHPPHFHVVAADGRPLGWITRPTQALAQEDVEVIFPNSGVRIEMVVSSEAASSMPFDSIPRSFAGFKFATTTIRFPTSSSGV